MFVGYGKFLKEYRDFIKGCKGRKFPEDVTYSENHHIIPKSFFKLKRRSNKLIDCKWNRIKLTAQEHFTAHRLLYLSCKEYYGQHHYYTKLANKAWSMFFKRSGDRTNITEEQYAELRIEFSKSERNRKKHSDKQKNKWSLERRGTRTGDDNPGISRRRPFIVTFLDGHSETHLGVRKFCRDRGYQQSGLYHLEKGAFSKHKDIIEFVWIR